MNFYLIETYKKKTQNKSKTCMSLILSENVRCQKLAHALWYYHVYIFTLFSCIVVNIPFLSSISAQTNFINIAGKGIHKAVIERAVLKNSPGKLAKALVRAVFSLEEMVATMVVQKKGREASGLPLRDQDKVLAIMSKFRMSALVYFTLTPLFEPNLCLR